MRILHPTIKGYGTLDGTDLVFSCGSGEQVDLCLDHSGYSCFLVGQKQVRRDRFVIECLLERELRSDEFVQHGSGGISDDTPANLSVFRYLPRQRMCAVIRSETIKAKFVDFGNAR